jgi:hypothetical protein
MVHSVAVAMSLLASHDITSLFNGPFEKAKHISPPIPQAGSEAQRSQRSALRSEDITLAETVEIRFRPHLTAVARDVLPAPEVRAVGGIWPCPHVRLHIGPQASLLCQDTREQPNLYHTGGPSVPLAIAKHPVRKRGVKVNLWAGESCR